MPLRILYEKYGESLTPDNIIKVVALLTEYQTGDVVVAVRDVYIQNPQIKIRVRAQCSVPSGFGGTFPIHRGLLPSPWGFVPTTAGSCITEWGCIPGDLHPQGPPWPPRLGEHHSPQAEWCWRFNPSCLQVLGEPMQQRKLVAEISLVNPLGAPLNNCVFVVEGAGLTEGQQIKEL